jgi:hypothetical protein
MGEWVTSGCTTLDIFCLLYYSEDWACEVITTRVCDEIGNCYLFHKKVTF